MRVINMEHMRMKRGGLFFFLLCIILLPFAFGVFSMLSASVGAPFAWTARGFSFSWLKQFFSDTALVQSLWMALLRGNINALITLFAVYVVGFVFVSGEKMQRLNVFFLTVPHVALAVGVSFLIAPSGILLRLIAPLFSWTRPPELTTVNDAYGIAMSFVVLMKIIPFVLFSLSGVLHNYTMSTHITQARLLGKNKYEIWTFVLFPQLMPKIILPFFICVSYAISPVDISTIIGPYTPPSIGVEIVTRFLQGSRESYINANIAGCLLTCATFVSIALWYCAFVGIRKVIQKTTCVSWRLPDISNKLTITGSTIFFTIFGVTAIASALLIVWSVVTLWQFPDLFPTEVSIDHIEVYGGRIFSSLGITIFLALASTILSLVVVLALLECMQRMRATIVLSALIILPLLIPQVTYVAGIHTLFLYLKINGGIFALVWAHMQYVVPYAFLVLYGPFKKYDNRYFLQGRLMGKSPWKVFLYIKIPMLLRPIAAAAGISMLVSVAQYLTTLFVGEGKIMTLTLFMVSLSAGGSRRMMSSVGVLLILLNVVIVIGVLLISRLQKGIRETRL